MPALVAAQHNPDLKRKYEALVAKGKPRKVALDGRDAEAPHPRQRGSSSRTASGRRIRRESIPPPSYPAPCHEGSAHG